MVRSPVGLRLLAVGRSGMCLGATIAGVLKGRCLSVIVHTMFLAGCDHLLKTRLAEFILREHGRRNHLDRFAQIRIANVHPLVMLLLCDPRSFLMRLEIIRELVH